MLQNLAITNDDCGGGQMVSVLAIYSDDPSSNPTGVYSFYSAKLFEKTPTETGNGPLRKQIFLPLSSGYSKKSCIVIGP